MPIRKIGLSALVWLLAFTGVLWNVAVETERTEAAPVNLALNKPITATSQGTGHVAREANDGNQNSYYESTSPLPQSLTVDLGRTYALNQAVLKLPPTWSDRSQTITLQGSIDNVTFTDMVPSTAYMFRKSDANIVTVNFPTGGARYFRVLVTAYSVRDVAALSELELYADPAAPDLIVTDISWTPAAPAPGDAVMFRATVKNIGQSSTPSGIGHKVSFRLDGTEAAQSAAYSDPIAPGGTAVIDAALPWTAEAFQFDVQAVANAEGTIGEVNAENNDDYTEMLAVTNGDWRVYFNLKDALNIYQFPEETLSYPLDFTGLQITKNHLRLKQFGVTDPIPYQLSDVQESNGYLVKATIQFRASLEIGTAKRFALDYDPSYTPSFPAGVTLTNLGDGTASIGNGLQMIRVPYGNTNLNNVPLSSVPAPLISIGRRSGEWLGNGSFAAPSGIKVTSMSGQVVEQGPLFLRYAVTYAISGGRSYKAVFTLHKNEKHVTVDETYSGFTSADTAVLRFSYKNGIDPDGRIVMQNGGYQRFSASSPGGASGKYGDNKDFQGKLPYELGMYTPNAIGLVHSTSFWKDGGEHAILFAVNRVRDWKTETRQIYQSFIKQNLRFYDTATDKYMEAGLEGTERHWAVSVIPRSEEVLSGLRSSDWKMQPPVLIDSVWTFIPSNTSLQPGSSPDVKLWERLADLSLNRYKDMVFDFPEDTSRKMPIPGMTTASLDSPAQLWDDVYYKFKYYNIISEKFWDISGELGGAAWAGRGQRLIFSTYADNRDKPGWALDARKQARSLMVFLAYTAEDDNNLPHTSMLGGHANFNLDIKSVLVLAAGVFPEHPKAATWKAEYMKDYNEVMDVWVRDADPASGSVGGRWYENLPTYTNASMVAILAARAAILSYDGSDPLFTQENFKTVYRWILNSLTAIEWGTFRAAVPIGAHASGGEPGGEFDGIYKLMADAMIPSDPVLGNQMLWSATNGAQGIKPDLVSSVYTDYGPVMRYGFGGPNESFVYLQQLNGPGYRWNATTNGTLYYVSRGKRYSWNGGEENGDSLDPNKLSMFHINGKGLGARPANGVLYNFGDVQYYKAQASTGNAPYLSRGVMMVQDRYIAIYDDVAVNTVDGAFRWSNRETGLKAEYFDNADFTNLVAVKTDRTRFAGTGSWGTGTPDPAVQPDTWSVRWTGKISPLYSESYTFYVTVPAGDAARMWVNNQLVVDTAAGTSAPVTLSANQLYDFKLEYAHTSGSASLTWQWSSPSQQKTQVEVGRALSRELDQMPQIYNIKEGPGDELHIVSPDVLSVSNAIYGTAVYGARIDPMGTAGAPVTMLSAYGTQAGTTVTGSTYGTSETTVTGTTYGTGATTVTGVTYGSSETTVTGATYGTTETTVTGSTYGTTETTVTGSTYGAAKTTVTAATYGTQSEYVFMTDTEIDVTDGTVSFTGTTGYAGPNLLALFEGSRIGYNGFMVERTGGTYGVSVKAVDSATLEGRLSGKSGGTVKITPPQGFNLAGAQVKINGVTVSSTVSNGKISFKVNIKQSDGSIPFTITGGVLFRDDFESGTASDWQANAGNWTVALDGSYVYQQSAATGSADSTAGDTSWSDYTLEAKVKITGTGGSPSVDLLGRYTNGNNMYYLKMSKAENKLKLYKKANGIVALLGSANVNVQTNTWYTLALSFTGSDIRGLINDVETIQATDTVLSSGKIGLRTSDVSAEFDDVIVR